MVPLMALGKALIWLVPQFPLRLFCWELSDLIEYQMRDSKLYVSTLKKRIADELCACAFVFVDSVRSSLSPGTATLDGERRPALLVLSPFCPLSVGAEELVEKTLCCFELDQTRIHCRGSSCHSLGDNTL